jgi:hypothetical protein
LKISASSLTAIIEERETVFANWNFRMICALRLDIPGGFCLFRRDVKVFNLDIF